jgi:multidrug efflux pump subunit AcrB
VVKNGILLIEYINDARKAGYSIEEACIDAVDKRFNAIILSAATTVIGLIPLALSGSSLFGPMAISLMFGLAVSTFLTMVVIPVVYSIFEGFLENIKKKRNAQLESAI